MTVIDVDATAPRDTGTAVVWSQVEPGFWAGSTDGEFLGTVERLRRGAFLARGATAEHVGEFASLAQARAAVTKSRGEIGEVLHAEDRRTP